MAGVLSSIRSIASNLVAKIPRNPSSSSSMDPHNCIEDLRKLVRTLQRIQAVLHDAEEREIRDESVKLWLRELKDIAYDAEDVLDDYQYEVLRSEVEARAALETATHKRKRVEEDHQEQVCDFVAPFSQLKVSIPDGMAEKIREIRMRFDEMAKDREAICLRPEDGERLFDFSIYPPPTSSHMDESGVVGREYDMEEVIDMLFSDTGYRFSVIPIIGMGGLGKTTLAQLVYNDPRVRRYFNLRGWVCVSFDFDVLRLAISLLESISKKSCDLTELSALHDALSEKVKGMRVLLVLDDVWNEKRTLWEPLRVAFLSAEMVRIIVTTRNDSVAKIIQTVPPYTLSGLPEEQCWLLFKQHAFGSENPNMDRDLVEIGEKIVKKCAGLPLAVKALGGLLRGETDRERWKEVLESDLWELDQGQDEILPALRLSYQRLPAYLKPCSVYCSLFPKDYKFEKHYIVRLWMAQGYIQPKGSRCLEDIGSDYFDELFRRSFFMLNHQKLFVMHDLMVDMSRSISREECCTIMTVEHVDDMMCSVLNKARHFYVGYGKIHKAVMENLSSHQITTGLHTFLNEFFFRCSTYMHGFQSANFGYLRVLDSISLKELRGTISSMKHLRYLNLICSGSQVLPNSLCQLYNLQSLKLGNCSNLTELPQGLGNLVNLRFLSISDGLRITKLPESLCLLYNLQTLDLESCYGVKELPSGIGELINLRHMFLPSGFCGPLGIERLKNLRSLGKENIKCKLEIRGLGNVDSKEDTQKLSLGWSTDYSGNELEIYWYGCVRFPGWTVYPSFSNLTSLQLLGCDITKTAILPPLAHLPALRYLSMVGIESIHRIGREFYRGVPDGSTAEALTKVYFPSLVKLVFDNMPKWEEWDGVLDVDFPCLRYLTIRICPELRRLPTLPSLQFLDVYYCEKLSSIPLYQNLCHPSVLQELRIKHCWKLTSIMVSQNLASLKNLHLESCPNLQCLPDEWLPVRPKLVEIVNCPMLQYWCERHNFSYFHVPLPIKKLAISNSLEITSKPTEKLLFLEYLSINNCSQVHLPTYVWIPSSLQYLDLFGCNLLRWLHLHQNLSALKTLKICSCPQLTSVVELHHLTSLECLVIKNCPEIRLSGDEWIPSSLQYLDLCGCNLLRWLHLHQKLSALKTLKICSCLQLTSVVGVHHLTSLERLVIRDCPEIRLSGDEWLPSTLMSLEVRQCKNLRSLPLLHQDLSALSELDIDNCSKLASVNGLNNLTSLQILSIMDCPELQLSPSERLSSMPEVVLLITCCPGLWEWCERQGIPYGYWGRP